ncbi:MAG: hypothetical protein PHE49_04930 [bacterium]|nr:hypothetical protein [bacterium]
MKVNKLKRKTIVKAIVDTLQPLDFVQALWEGGAAAFNRVDKWSDIDIMVAANDDAVNKVFQHTEKTLKKLSYIEILCEMPLASSGGFHQRFYKLKDTDKFLLIDFAIAKLSKPDKFLQKEIHGNALVHFDKNNIIKCKPIRTEDFKKQIKAQFDNLKIKFELFHDVFFLKEINRKNYIEALDFYMNFMISYLVIVLRIKYSPFHYTFRSKYIYYDLPKNISKKLEKLYFIKDVSDLKVKHKIVKKWFYSVLKDLNL